MSALKDEKKKEILRELAAEFFSRESNRQSMITVTGVELQGKGSRAKILVTVLPADQEEKAVSFMHRQLTEFREHVMARARLMQVPYFEVAIDKGEKNRQRLDDISKNM